MASNANDPFDGMEIQLNQNWPGEPWETFSHALDFEAGEVVTVARQHGLELIASGVASAT